MRQTKMALGGALLLAVALQGCGGGSGGETATPPADKVTAPETYSFESRFGEGSSVAYSGQVARQVLIDGLNREIGGLGTRVGQGEFNGYTRDQVVAILDSYYVGGTDTLADNPLALSTNPATSQRTYGEISLGKNLVGKTAGNDSKTDHKDWNNGDFVGWSGAASPQALIQSWFGIIGDNVVAQAGGQARVAPISGEALEPYQTVDGLDLKQLTQKFLLGAVAFSQAADDYLDDATPDKGLLTDNVNQDGTNPYTKLEHQWDEGFGYFGAARDYNSYTDQALKDEGYKDSNGDAATDLKSEFNFPFAVYAAKRDLSSTSGIDFTKAIFDALLQGRAIISSAGGALTDAQLADLQAQRDIAVANWEKVIAANVVHYTNSVLKDMAADPYNYSTHAKHWGEMKGFALGLQFNPRSPLTDAQFAEIHQKLGDRPVLPNASAADVEAYKTALLDARAILQAAYGFEQADVEKW